jgi:SAM-dependent methyltransferase
VEDRIQRSEARTAFGSDLAGYDAGRPDYPERVYEILVERCGLRPGVRVLEIGPGTGRATHRLLAAGAHVLGVEPDPTLAAHLRDRYPEVEVIECDFETAPLDDQAFDLAVAAMAFHWVDQSVGLPKLGRLVTPGGWVALWWTLWGDPDRPDAFALAAQQLDDRRTESEANEPGRPQFELDAEARVSDLESQAGLVDVSQEAVRWSIEMDAAQVRAHYASMIGVRRRSPEEQERFLHAVADLVTSEFGGKVERNFLTVLYTGRRPTRAR